MGSTAARPVLRRTHKIITHSRCKGNPPRRDAMNRVSHRPDGPVRGKNVGAGLSPERVRRDESRLYAGNIQLRGKILSIGCRE